MKVTVLAASSDFSILSTAVCKHVLEGVALFLPFFWSHHFFFYITFVSLFVFQARTPLPVDQPSDSEVSSEAEGGVTDTGDCTIVGYLKPRHERTPEIITLSDTDEDVNVNLVGISVSLECHNK